MKILGRLLFNQAPDGGGAGGSSGASGTVADGGQAGGAKPPEGAGAGAGSSSSAGTDGKTSQRSAWEKDTIVWNGKETELSRDEIIKYAQQAYNVTQREQAASKKWKEATAQLARLEKLIEDAEKKGGAAGGKGGEGEGEGEDDPVETLSQKYNTLEQQLKIQAADNKWKEAFAPVKQKFPNLPSEKLEDLFMERVEAGAAEDSEAGLMAVAEELSKTLEQEKSTQENKLLEKLLSNSEDPRVKAHNDRVIADYVAGKIKLSHSGGEHGSGGSGGAGGEDKRSIGEIAAALRTKN